jgi:TolB-like protein/tetratricopeptide (TPR) repeat protein
MASIVRFDCYEVDLASGQLCKRGVRVPLRDKSFVLLTALLEHPGELVTREELRRRLWHDDVFVDFDNNLNTVLGRLREVLNDSAENPRFIETLPKRGYRFIAKVHPVPSPSPEFTGRTRLLVLPFVNLTGDPREEYFIDAMTDEVITAIAGLSPEHLGVIARTTTMRYKGSRKDVEKIGRELAVDYVVEGGVRRAESQVTLNIQLIQVKDQTHLFSRRYDAPMGDLFTLHSRVALAIATHIPSIAETLRTHLPDQPERARSSPTQDIVAYNLYLQGRYHLNKYTPEGMAKAKQYFEEALARDPNFALPNDGLAELYWFLGFYGFAPPKEACSAGLFYALRAVEIDNTLAETHALIGMYRKELDYNWPEVQREMHLALELNPASPVVRFRYALSGLMPQGHLREAIAALEFVIESDPLSVNNHLWMCAMLWMARDFDRALEEARRGIELDAASFLGYYALGQARIMQHVFGEAISALQKAAELSGNSPTVLVWLGLALAQGGRATEARALLHHLHAMATQAYVPPTGFAWIYLGLGEIDEAFVWMDRAIDARDPMMVPIKSYAFLDPLRADPRFAALLRKMNLG